MYNSLFFRCLFKMEFEQGKGGESDRLTTLGVFQASQECSQITIDNFTTLLFSVL